MKVAEAAEERPCSRPRAAAATRTCPTQACTSLLDDDVHQPAWNHADLDNLLACDRGSHFFVGESYFFNVVFRRVRRDNDAAANFAVDLDGEFDFIFFGESGVVFGPGGAKEA